MPGFGVVIPTHNGSSQLHRSIGSLSLQCFSGGLQARHVRVVVAVNDERAESFARAVELRPLLTAAGVDCEVIRTAPGRSAAIRAADRLLGRHPRLYLDQDAVLSANALGKLAAILAPGSGVHFAAPSLRLAKPSSRSSRAYYRVWRELPYVLRSPVTCGAYAVSAAGRDRWTELPVMHSDDKWVRWHFAAHERRVVAGATYEVVVPEGLRALIRARHRYHRGNRELVKVGVPPHSDDAIRHRGVVHSLIASPGIWPAAAVFVAVHAAVALLDTWPETR
jgi:hypothetical protein